MRRPFAAGGGFPRSCFLDDVCGADKQLPMTDAMGRKPRTALPDSIPLFPLPGALLLPGGQLPLNIFEPRYLRMVDDALAGARMIGMIQPAAAGPDPDHPRLYEVGCGGRLTDFSETGDGRYLITLTGVSRFKVKREIAGDTPYRLADADWSSFERDFHPDLTGENIDRTRFLKTARRYLAAEGLKTDWDVAEEAPIEALISSMCMGCPFAVNEKQALLEAETLKERADCLIALMEMSTADDSGGDMLQ